jgi:hypothetical protein
MLRPALGRREIDLCIAPLVLRALSMARDSYTEVLHIALAGMVFKAGVQSARMSMHAVLFASVHAGASTIKS